MFYICLYNLTSAEDTFENLFWLHRYANDLLSPLFMPAGTPIPLILYVSFIYRHIKKHITFSMGEGIANIWRLYWRRISNIYFYLSAFQQNTNWSQTITDYRQNITSMIELICVCLLIVQQMIHAHRIFVSVILIWQIKQKSLEIFGYPLLDTSLIYISCTHARYVTSSTDEDKTDFQELFYSFCDFLCFVFNSVDSLNMVGFIISTCSC